MNQQKKWNEREMNTLFDVSNIKGFFEEYRWLSNFHLCPVKYTLYTFPSSENAYQAAKCLNHNDVIKFFTIPPSEAKRLGQKITIRPDWEDVKVSEMEKILISKFTLNEDLKAKLLETGEKYLEETNWWKDTFWGVCNDKGENHLGKILMKIREQLKTVENGK